MTFKVPRNPLNTLSSASPFWASPAALSNKPTKDLSLTGIFSLTHIVYNVLHSDIFVLAPPTRGSVNLTDWFYKHNRALQLVPNLRPEAAGDYIAFSK